MWIERLIAIAITLIVLFNVYMGLHMLIMSPKLGIKIAGAFLATVCLVCETIVIRVLIDAETNK